jgi:hypothetical protein
METEHYSDENGQFALFPDSACKCFARCTCQCPEPAAGAALVSNDCPIHNLVPEPNEWCIVHGGE